MGKLDSRYTQDDTTLFVFTCQKKKLADLWQLDILGIIDLVEKRTQEEHKCAVHEASLHDVKCTNDSQYEVKMPWRKNHPAMPSNKKCAEKRLKAFEKKSKAENLYNNYNNVLKK